MGRHGSKLLSVLLLLLTTAPAAAQESRAGFTLEVRVLDYVSHAPIAGVEVVVSEMQTCNRNSGCRPAVDHPEHLKVIRQTTGADGRTVFALPDKVYGHNIPPQEVNGYLTYAAHYHLGRKKRGPLYEESWPDAQHEIVTFYLVPASLVEVTTREQAVALARANPELAEWLAQQPDRDSLEITVKGGGTTWQVGFGRNRRLKRQVHVNAFDGTTTVNGRWN